MYTKFFFCLLILFCFGQVKAQVDSTLSRVKFDLDFRFRAEQDWDSKRSDGTLRDDRTRLRYRLRTGATYLHKDYSFGVRVRTGDPNKQQDPQLTLGKGLKEFGTLPIGFEKAYFQYHKKKFRFWLGKNDYPFEKNNELFWSDNVFPEGVMVEKVFLLDFKYFDQIKLIGGHFILGSNDGTLSNDAYLQGFQTSLEALDNRIKFFPSIYIFRNIPNVPDGSHTALIDYSIFHLGAKLKFLKNKKLSITLDYYKNIQDYSMNADIDSEFSDQTTGVTLGAKYGAIEVKNDWLIQLTYANLERYAILDYMAQNDWARWDYSAFNSPDGRLSNYQGIEFVTAYAITNKINLVSKYYMVNQLLPFGTSKETGQRIRFDINVRI